MTTETDKQLAERILKQHELNRDGHSGMRESMEIHLARRLLFADAKLRELHERLEDNHVYVGPDMVRKEVPPGSIPDGISCRNETIRMLQESLKNCQERKVPTGWKLVPVEATERMLREGLWELRASLQATEHMAATYKAMIAASPTPPGGESVGFSPARDPEGLGDE